MIICIYNGFLTRKLISICQDHNHVVGFNSSGKAKPFIFFGESWHHHSPGGLLANKAVFLQDFGRITLW